MNAQKYVLSVKANLLAHDIFTAQLFIFAYFVIYYIIYYFSDIVCIVYNVYMHTYIKSIKYDITICNNFVRDYVINY